MEIALTNDEEIIMILSRKIYIPEIVYRIIQWKRKLEDKNTLNYHIERWETISSKYFRSLEKDYHGVVIPQSYSIDSKYFVSNIDKCLEFYNETGISYQVRDLLLDILQCPMGSLFTENIMDCTLFEWRQNIKEKNKKIINRFVLDFLFLIFPLDFFFLVFFFFLDLFLFFFFFLASSRYNK